METYTDSMTRMKDYFESDPSLFSAYWNSNLLMMTRLEGYGAYLWIQFPIDETEVSTLDNLQADNHEDYAGRLEQALATIRDEAQSTYDAICAGETTFDEVFAQKGAGPYFDADSVPQGIGYCIGETNGELYPEVIAAALSLETGEMSELVAANDGYYIIKKVADIEPGDLSFEDAKATLEPTALSEKKSDVYEQCRVQWADEAQIVTYYDFWSES